MRFTTLKDKIIEPPRQAVAIAVLAFLIACAALILAVHRAG